MLSITTVPSIPEHAASLTASQYETLSVVEQFQRSFSSGNRLGFVIGTAIGSFVPLASYEIVHFEAITNPWLWALVANALIFSGLSVFRWASSAFDSGFGFVVLCEGVMVASHCRWLALVALALLVTINAVSAACALQVSPDSTVTSDTGMQSLGLTQPNVTVNIANQQNVIPARSSRSEAEHKAAAARRSRQYRERKRLAAGSQTA